LAQRRATFGLPPGVGEIFAAVAPDALPGLSDAWEQFHRPRVVEAFRRCGMDPSTAEDLAQELVMAALAYRATPILNPDAWLVRVGSRLLIGKWRRKTMERKHLRRYPPPVEETPPQAEPGVDPVRLTETIARLPGHYRQALLWTFLDGEPPRLVKRRISLRRGIARESARKFLYRARRMGRAVAEGEDPSMLWPRLFPQVLHNRGRCCPVLSRSPTNPTGAADAPRGTGGEHGSGAGLRGAAPFGGEPAWLTAAAVESSCG
jgi:DNA-directed RNA polymerase specialized sigma24 family protein